MFCSFSFLGEFLINVYSVRLVFLKSLPSPSLCKYGSKFRSPWSSSVLVIVVFGECSMIVICSFEVFWCFFNLEICIGQ